MDRRTVKRRGFLAFLGSAAGLIWRGGGGGAAEAAAASKQDEFLENGAGTFRLEVPDTSSEDGNIQSISVEDLTIDVRETTAGDSWDFRTYAPGQAHYGNVTLRMRTGPQTDQLRQWLEEAAVGKNIRKNISVILLTRAGQEARRWNLSECFPIKWDAGDYSPSSTCQNEGSVALVVMPLQVSLCCIKDRRSASEAVGFPDLVQCDEQMVPVRIAQRFYHRDRLPYAARLADPVTGEVSPWSGFEQFVPELPAHFVTGQIQQGLVEVRPRFVDEIVLRRPLTARVGPFDNWLAESLAGRKPYRNVTIVELKKDGSEGTRYAYTNCLITRVVFPHLDAAGTGNLYEEVSLKPERLELQ